MKPKKLTFEETVMIGKLSVIMDITKILNRCRTEKGLGIAIAKYIKKYE